MCPLGTRASVGLVACLLAVAWLLAMVLDYAANSTWTHQIYSFKMHTQLFDHVKNRYG